MTPGGYAWWYVDGLSDDGRHGLTMIAFVGSVFSPYYAWSGRGDPANHCAINIALYGDRPRRWAMTERGRAHMSCSADRFSVGPSALHWTGEGLDIEINEIANPLPRRVRGTIRIRPSAITGEAYVLDGAGRHVWWPVAPVSRIEVDFNSPEIRWQGQGYFDCNAGSESLEEGFTCWDWSRAHMGSDAVLLYEPTERGGGGRSLALRIDRQGNAVHIDPPEIQRLPTALWGIKRATRSDAGTTARVISTFEDTPFYARSLVEMTLDGQRTRAFHESLDLDRFASNWVKMLLPFRMPRNPF